MTGYWARIEPFWNDLPTDDPAAYRAFFDSMPPVAGHLIATHWVVSEVSNGGLHQLFTNSTGVVVPEAVAGFRAMGLTVLADIVAEAAAFFGSAYPREQMARIGALDRHAAGTGDPDDWNPFEALDDRFDDALEVEGDEDAYTRRANAFAAGG